MNADPIEPEYPTLEQFTTPVDDQYVALVGQATYAFAYLEWQVVSLGQRIAPGFIYDAATMTAGTMARELKAKVASFAGDASLQSALSDLALKFSGLVKRRNDLVHAHPATFRGEQRLHYWSPRNIFTWEPEDIVVFVHEIEALAREGNKLYYDPRMQ